MIEFDVIIIGAGTVGATVAYGLARLGRRVLVLDGADTDFRAARANFGLVWAQGKGQGMTAYQRLTRQSTDLWPEFLAELRDRAGGMRVDYERKGGLVFCLGETGFKAREADIAHLANELAAVDPTGGAADTEMLDRVRLQALLPNLRLGAEVSGASYCWRDGHVNPLQLLAALHDALVRMGGEIRPGHQVQAIRHDDGVFTVETQRGSWRAGQVVIAAGIASGTLARQVGLDVPIKAQRGQILVTQRAAPVLPLPCSGLRQTSEGTVMIGATQENVGETTTTTASASTYLASRAVRIAPDLSRLQLVRQWSGLRILSPDGYPIYAESQKFPGAFVVTCHSGVTLAAVHAGVIANDIAGGGLSAALDPFHHRRFYVQAVS